MPLQVTHLRIVIAGSIGNCEINPDREMQVLYKNRIQNQILFDPIAHCGIVLLLQAPRCHQKILREKKTPSGGEGPKPSLNPNRASYPGALVTSATSATSSEAGSGEGNHLSCRFAVPQKRWK